MNSPDSIRNQRIAVLIVAGLAGVTLAGCGRRPIVVQTPAPTIVQAAPAPAPVIAAPAPAPAPTGQPAVIVVNQPPPAPLPETPAPQPSSQHVWIPGYWAWRSNQQQWVPGRWETPPRPGATWVPSRWERRGTDYVFVDGYWQ